jgi:hypothetical protein
LYQRILSVLKSRFVPGALLIAGAYMSMRYSLGLWHADPDVAVPVNLWRGIQAHGPSFAETWHHSPDNWLFSLVPLDALLLTISPHNPTPVVLSGWVIFIASAVLSGLLLSRVADARAGWWLTAVLSFANYQALGEAGFLSYPITHNISMLWALGALWLAVESVRQTVIWRAGVLIAASAVCLLVNAVSDPWAGAAIVLPVALVALIVGAFDWRSFAGRVALALGVATGLVLLTAQTHVFGLLGFLPPSPFLYTNAEGVMLNAGWGFRALAAIGAVIPHANWDSSPVIVINGVITLTVMAIALIFSTLLLRRAELATRLLVGVCVVSIGAITGALLVGEWPRGLLVGRFFPNAYFFGAILAGFVICRFWPVWPRLMRAAVVIYVALFMLAGVMSLPRVWLGLKPPRNNDDILSVSKVLQKEGLTYGYGPYWGAFALSQEWLTQGKVIVRPVSFREGSFRRRQAETSKYWYVAADEPAGLRERFLVIMNDGEECPVIETCVAVAQGQFGAPLREIPFFGGVILTWDHPIWSGITHRTGE